MSTAPPPVEHASVPWGPKQVAIGGFIALFIFLVSSIVSAILIAQYVDPDARTDEGDIFEKAVAIAEYADERLQAAAEGESFPEVPVITANVEALKYALGATLVYEVAVIAMVGIVAGLGHTDLFRVLGMNRYDWTGIWRPVVCFFAAYTGIILYIFLISQLNIEFLIPSSTVPGAVLRDDAVLAMSAVIAVLAAPLSEEVFFRGFLFGGLSRWGFWPAAAISSALFTAVHFDPGSLLPFFAIGLVMCWLYWRRGNLWDAIIFHVLFNGTSTAFLLAQR